MLRAIFAAIANALRALFGLAALPFCWLFGARPPETEDLAVARHTMAGAIDEQRRAEEMEAQLVAAEAHEIEQERLAALRSARKASTPRRPVAKIFEFPAPVDDEPDQDAAPAPRM